SCGDPADIFHDIDPRLGLVMEHSLHGAGGSVRKVEIVLILQTIQLLDRERVRVAPIHACEVVLTWIAGYLQPLRRATADFDRADAYCGVRRDFLQIGYWRLRRVEREGIVDQQKD